LTGLAHSTEPLPSAAPALGPGPASSPSRALAWAWLSALFTHQPDAAAIAAHRIAPIAELIADLARDDDLAAPLAAMRDALDGDDAAVAVRLARAHGRLFLGLAGPETVAPYESAHVGDGRLFGAAVGDMERLLAAHDLSVARDSGEPADHLAIETALMAALTEEDHPDRAVLAARLAGWVPAFARACAARDRTGFYAAAARLVATLAEREARGRRPE
jgi:TorA maturation chaperone TorD